jgi:2-polyprenyl-3-methyl-5-hydroxy-6-metoxy-1,4-benzoquinol methylase
MDKKVIYSQYHRFVTASWSVPPVQSEYETWVKQARTRLADLLPVSRRSNILDLGCGAGHLLYLLRETGYRNIQGVDACAGAVARAQQMSLPVEAVDIFAFLESTEQSFDCITAFDVIEHLTRPQFDQLLDLIRLRLNSGGHVIFQTINGESPWCQSYFSSDPTHETLFSPRSITSLLGLNGFSEVIVREVVPPPSPIKHRPRYYAWKALRLAYAACNFVETGTGTSGVYSRNFLLRARLVCP